MVRFLYPLRRIWRKYQNINSYVVLLLLWLRVVVVTHFILFKKEVSGCIFYSLRRIWRKYQNINSTYIGDYGGGLSTYALSYLPFLYFRQSKCRFDLTYFNIHRWFAPCIHTLPSASASLIMCISFCPNCLMTGKEAELVFL